MFDQHDALPQNIKTVLADFTQAATQICGDNLISVVLFGSAAEGRLRASSDVNVLLEFKTFDVSQINQLREKLRLASAAINMKAMFLLEAELATAADSFALKFSDISQRHHILFGKDPFEKFVISKNAILMQLKQTLLNLKLRLRERYAVVSLRDEQLVPIIADVTGPIRTCAAAILTLEGEPPQHPKEALQKLTQRDAESAWGPLLENMSAAREGSTLAVGVPTATVLGLIKLLDSMDAHVLKLS